jgi:hypothetical protein
LGLASFFIFIASQKQITIILYAGKLENKPRRRSSAQQVKQVLTKMFNKQNSKNGSS